MQRLNVQNDINFHPENADSGGKFAVRSMVVIGKAFNRRSDSIIHAFLLSIFCGAPLINNLDSRH